MKEYAQAYSTILAAQINPRLEHVYVDAFAGTGIHISRSSGNFIPGSPLNALNVEPPFSKYLFIDINKIKVQALHEIAKERPGQVSVYEGDCNEILLKEVFPKIGYEDYRRGMCLLDPYGLHIDWKVIEAAGKMRSIEIFYNLSIYDMNLNVLWKNPENVPQKQVSRLNKSWGDDSWRKLVYSANGNLFGYEEKKHNVNEEIAEGFRCRLKEVAGFSYVPKPLPMRNSTGNIIYYLFFASPKPVAAKIVKDIFDKYRHRSS